MSRSQFSQQALAQNSSLPAQMPNPMASALPPSNGGQALAPEGLQLPHDIEGLASYSFFAIYKNELLIALFTFVIGGILAVAFYRWYQKRRGLGLTKEEKIDPLVGMELQLSELSVPASFEGKVAQEFYFQLNMLLRQFIEYFCKFPATDLTYNELKIPMRTEVPLEDIELKKIMEFCYRSDLIKFAEAPTNSREAEEALGEVRRWSSLLKEVAEDSQPETDDDKQAQELNADGVVTQSTDEHKGPAS